MICVIIKKKSILTLSALALVMSVLMAGVALTQSAGMILGRPLPRRMPITSVHREERLVALSFDASTSKTVRSDTSIDDIVTVLQMFGVPVSFFVLGAWAEANRADLDTMVGSDFVEIGIKSNTHVDLTSLSHNQITRELQSANAVLQEIVGREIELFRPPLNSFNGRVLDVASSLGLRTIGHDVDSGEDADAQQVALRVLSNVQNGSIILLRDSDNIAAILSMVIMGLKNQGFGFVTVGDILLQNNYTVDNNGRQIPV